MLVETLEDLGNGSNNALWYDIWDDTVEFAKRGWSEVLEELHWCEEHETPVYRCGDWQGTDVLKKKQWIQWVERCLAISLRGRR